MEKVKEKYNKANSIILFFILIISVFVIMFYTGLIEASIISLIVAIISFIIVIKKKYDTKKKYSICLISLLITMVLSSVLYMNVVYPIIINKICDNVETIEITETGTYGREKTYHRVFSEKEVKKRINHKEHGSYLGSGLEDYYDVIIKYKNGKVVKTKTSQDRKFGGDLVIPSGILNYSFKFSISDIYDN